MEDFKNIIDYLRFSRRSDEARAQNKHLSAVKVDSNFQNGIPHEEDIVVIEKSALKNNTEYQLLNDIADAYVNTLYVHEQPNDEIEYYIKKDFNENGNIVTKYKRVPLSNDGNENAWEEKDNTIFTRINVSGDFYYSHIENKFFLVFTEDVFLFQDVFAYSKNDLPDNKSGDYTFEYINERGRKKDPKSRRFNHTALKAKRTVNFNKGNDAGLVNLFPNIKGDTIQYNYFEKGVPFDSSLNKHESALTLKFGHFGALLEFLNQTIFYQLNETDDFHTSLRNNFLDHYNTYISNLVRYYQYKGDELLTLIYFLPEPAFQHLDMLNLWDLVDGMLENSVTNIDLLKEDILLKLLDVLYQNSKTHQIFLLELLKQNAKNKTRLERLIYRLDDKSNTALIKFIYDVWKNSKFVLPDTKQIPKYKETNGPLFLPYEAEKWAGFYFSNAKVNFNKQEVEIDFKTGKFEDVEIASPKLAGGKGTKKQEIIEHYTYHPFYPIYIKDVEKQDTLITFNSIIPAFMLYVNEDKTFWHNFIKTGEYTLDIVTTLSGIGNLAKFRHLAKLGKAKSIIAKVKLGAGFVELTSGTTNTLLKLTDIADTEIGKAISEYLFWLELLSLGGELTVAIKNGLQKSAKTLTTEENLAKLNKSLDDLVKKGELDEAGKGKVIDKLFEVAGVFKENIDILKKNAQYLKQLNIVNSKRAFEVIMSAELEAAIRYYTTFAFQELNIALRGFGELTEELKAFKIVLNKALDKLPIDKVYNNNSYLLYRSVEFSEELIQKIKKEGNFVDEGFFSTSYDYQKFLDNWLSYNPHHNVIFKVYGKNGKLIEKASDITPEAEILFKSGTEFDALSVKRIRHPLDTQRTILEIILKEK